MPNILLVEDEAILSEPFALVLRLAAFEVDVARNGKEAMELCRKHEYDLILLDLMMPVLDGVGFLEQLQAERRLGSTRVIVLSNVSSGPDITEALALGAHRHVLKSGLSPRDIVSLAKSELQAV